jgi:hypothetical protein
VVRRLPQAAVVWAVAVAVVQLWLWACGLSMGACYNQILAPEQLNELLLNFWLQNSHKCSQMAKT